MMHAAYVTVTSADRRENSIFVMILQLVSLGVYVFLRKNIGRIESVFFGIENQLSEKDLAHIGNKDKWIAVWQGSTCALTTLAMLVTVVQDRKLLREEFQYLGLTSDIVVVVVALFSFFFYMKIVCGVILCSIQIYSVSMVVFERLSHNLKRTIKETLVDGVTVQGIVMIRSQLRGYWHWKIKADKFLNVFPFIWAVYLFLSVALIMTKLIADWKTVRVTGNLFLINSTAFSLLILLVLALKWHLFTAPDRTMDKCMQLVFCMTDTRLSAKKSVQNDPQLEREILSMHLELANAPDTHSTILGAIRMNFASLISYFGALVNFAVMIINIRMAIRDAVK